MTYSQAKKAFEDNRARLGPKAHPEIWNLSAGLLRLTEAIEHDMAEIRERLGRIEQSQEHRK